MYPRVWVATLNVASFYHDDELSLAERAKMMAAAIRSKFPKRVDIESDEFDDELDLCAEEFEEIGSGDVDASEFDTVLDRLYDWADSESVWVQTR